MAQRTLTKRERQVAVIVEQALNAMIETRLSLEDIIDAAAQSAERRGSNATVIA